MCDKPVRTSYLGRIWSYNCTAHAWVDLEPLSWVRSPSCRGYDPCMDTRGARRVWIRRTEQSQWQETTSMALAPLTVVIRSDPASSRLWNVHSRLPVASRLGYFRCTCQQMCMCNYMDTNTFNVSFSFLKQHRLLNYLMSSKTQTVAYYLSFSGVTVLLEPRYYVFNFSLVRSDRLKRNQSITPRSYHQACFECVVELCKQGKSDAVAQIWADSVLWGKYADDLAKALITSAQNEDFSVVQKKNTVSLGPKLKENAVFSCIVS